MRHPEDAPELPPADAGDSGEAPHRLAPCSHVWLLVPGRMTMTKRRRGARTAKKQERKRHRRPSFLSEAVITLCCAHDKPGAFAGSENRVQQHGPRHRSVMDS